MSMRKHLVSGSELGIAVYLCWEGEGAASLSTEAERLWGQAQVREAACGTSLPDPGIKHIRGGGQRPEAGEVSRNREELRREGAELPEHSWNRIVKSLGSGARD